MSYQQRGSRSTHRPSRCPSKDIALRSTNRFVPILLFTLAGCSAMGMELENYAFYGSNPTPNGRRLKTFNVIERVQTITGSDTVDVVEGEFQVDTGRINNRRVWVATRRSTELDGTPVLDSVWLERLTLKTIKSFRQDSDGSTWLEFNRRQVRSVRITPEGRRQTWRGLHQAAPYSMVGIEVVLGALPMRVGDAAALPVVSGRGRRMDWLRYRVLDRKPEALNEAGGVLFRSIYVVEVALAGVKTRYWVDAEEKSVIRRQLAMAEGPAVLVIRGKPVPRISLFPVEPLARFSAPGRGRPVLLQQSRAGS